MVQHESPDLDRSFAALSDPTRRGVIEVLGRADASISTLASRFGMTLTGMKKHVRILEEAGFVATTKVGRTRTCRLGHARMKEEAAWIERTRQLWETRLDALDRLLEDTKEGSAS